MQRDNSNANLNLAEAFYSNGRYNPISLTVAGIGFLAIYLLTQSGIFGEPVPQLIYIGGITLLLAVSQLPTLELARRGQGIAAIFIAALCVGIFSITLMLFWQGMVFIAILFSLVTPVTAMRRGLPSTHRNWLVALAFAITVGIFYANSHAPDGRLQNSSPAAIASIAFLTASGLLLLTITTISQSKRFKSLQSLLLTSFVIIVTIATLMSSVLSAVGTYTNSQTQTYKTLQAVTSLKENQIRELLDDYQADAQKLQNDPQFITDVLEVLDSQETNPAFLENSKKLVRSRVETILGLPGNIYSEAMLLNPQHEIMISSNPAREGADFGDQISSQQGISKSFASFADKTLFGDENLIIAIPFFDANEQTSRGLIALRFSAAPIVSLMENTTGFEEAETYLVGSNFAPLTPTYMPVDVVHTQATVNSITSNVLGGQGIYESYTGQQVLGYYEWFEPLQLAIVAEIPLSSVIASSLSSLAGSSFLILFIVAIAIAAVAISARSISEPIRALSQITDSFAAGKLSARASVERMDEIGTLATGYNKMAEQLQEVIDSLEQRVAARTQDLEGRTLRLRVAAEIARDAAIAHDLRDLLERATRFILNRFNYYHTGIYLLDNNGEYAVLVASPTAAGQQMIANRHKFRVGEAGLIGRVAASEEPQIASDPEVHPFDNPLLPNTQSEMALPLKVENKIIGVLDIHSDHAQAFKEDDMAIMQVMADQLATAIDRTRLLDEVERNLGELETAYGQFTRDNWRKLAESGLTGNKGYRFDNIRLESISELPELSEEALASGKLISSNGTHRGLENTVAIPIKLRGQTIGVVSLKLKEGYDANTIATVEAAAERLASVMESARLYEEARLRADREQSISRITTAISASTEYEQILQATVREIGSLLSDTEVAVQILDEANPALAEKKDQ